jgi:succinate dehydrogenase / fumarate reductase, cytochrome b subunit
MTQAIERPSGAHTPTVNPPKPTSRLWLVTFYRTAVGKKWVMAITGIVLMGYVLAHMVGNLKMFLGRAEFDRYAESLRELLYPILPHTTVLWIMRAALIAAFFLHIQAAYSLTRMNQRSRPVKYQSPRDYIAVTFASRTMRWTGIIITLFVAWHLADLTWGWVNPDFVKGAAYDNLVASFDRLPVAILYVVANLALGVHLFHGAWSIFQSMGLNSPRYNRARRTFAIGFAVVVTVPNVAFPIMVQAGVVS